MPHLRWALRAVSATLIGTATAAGAAGTRFGLEAGLEHDNNVNRSASAQALSDQAATVEGYAARSAMTGVSSGFVTRFAARVQGYREYGGLSHIAVAGRFSWRYQPDPSFTGAWLSLDGSAEIRRHADSELRDGELLSLGAGVGKYFTDRLRTHARAGLDRRFASHGDVYDLSSWRLTAGADWRAGAALTLYASTSWIEGDQVFTWSPAAGSSYRHNGRTDWYTASGRDETFDDSGRRFWAFRADSTTKVLDAGANFAFDGQTALDVGAQWYRSEAENGPAYDGLVVRVLFLKRLR